MSNWDIKVLEAVQSYLLSLLNVDVIQKSFVTAQTQRLLRQREEAADDTDHHHQEHSQEGARIANEDSSCSSRLITALAPTSTPAGRSGPRAARSWSARGTYTRSRRKAGASNRCGRRLRGRVYSAIAGEAACLGVAVLRFIV